MDEYLFITMAKLKADRLRLEREAQARDEVSEPRKQLETQIESPARVRTSWFSRAHQWRAQS